MVSLINCRSLKSLFKFIIADSLFSRTSSHLYCSAVTNSNNEDPVNKELKEGTKQAKLKFFSDLLGTPPGTTSKFLNDYHPSLLSKTVTIKATENKISFLGKLGIERSEISKNLAIFEISSSVITKRYYSLREIGIEVVGIPDILNYKALLACSFTTLRDQKYIVGDENPFIRVLEKHKYPVDLTNTWHNPCLSYEKLSIAEFREKIITNCISFYFKFSPIQSALIYKSAKLLSDTSIADVLGMLKYIVESIEINPEIICLQPEVLHLCVSEVQKIKTKCQLLNLDLKNLINNFPKILLCNSDNFSDICNYLLDFGISKEQITQCPRVFSLTPDFIKDGLRTINLWPEILVLAYDLNFLNILMNYKKANLHMFYIRKAGIDQFTASRLLVSDFHFKSYINRQVDRSSSKVIKNYIASKLECSSDDVLAIIRHHPLYQHASVITVRNNLALLNNCQFTKQQILRGLSVLFYPTDRVAKSLKEIPKLPFAQPYDKWRNSVHILQLIMYILDRDEFIYHDR